MFYNHVTKNSRIYFNHLTNSSRIRLNLLNIGSRGQFSHPTNLTEYGSITLLRVGDCVKIN
jgi:hypothetical protein